MKPRFLLDENLPKRLLIELRRKIPDLEIERVGELGVPDLGTPDPDILRWIEKHNYILVTNNRKSMPVHIADHFAEGRHFPGIIVMTQDMSIGEVVSELEIIWGASEAEEYFDRVEFIPL
jgi:hypothetical protein